MNYVKSLRDWAKNRVEDGNFSSANEDRRLVENALKQLEGEIRHKEDYIAMLRDDLETARRAFKQYKKDLATRVAKVIQDDKQ